MQSLPDSVDEKKSQPRTVNFFFLHKNNIWQEERKPKIQEDEKMDQVNNSVEQLPSGAKVLQ